MPRQGEFQRAVWNRANFIQSTTPLEDTCDAARRCKYRRRLPYRVFILHLHMQTTAPKIHQLHKHQLIISSYYTPQGLLFLFACVEGEYSTSVTGILSPIRGNYNNDKYIINNIIIIIIISFGIVVSTSAIQEVPGSIPDYRPYPRNVSGSIGSGTGSTEFRLDNWIAACFRSSEIRLRKLKFRLKDNALLTTISSYTVI